MMGVDHGSLTIRADGTATIGVLLRPEEIEALLMVQRITGIKSNAGILRIALVTLALGGDEHIRRAVDVVPSIAKGRRLRRHQRSYRQRSDVEDEDDADPDTARLQHVVRNLAIDVQRRRGSSSPGHRINESSRDRGVSTRGRRTSTAGKAAKAKHKAPKKRGRRPKGEGSASWDKLDPKRKYQPQMRSQLDVWRHSPRGEQ